MNEDRQSSDFRLKQARAVKTAWVFAIIAVVIFATFIGSAIIGR